MLHHVVFNHAECTAALADHDAVGTNWRGNHYSGNFWWARADHIRRLPDIKLLRHRPLYLSADPIWNARLQCEFWIGMTYGRFKNLGPEGLDLYCTIRWGTSAHTIVRGLLEAQGGTRYLELAMAERGTWIDAVEASVKHTVSPDIGATFVMSEQEFIASGFGCERYDLIAIDSSHEEHRCLAALEWALGCVERTGAILVHDSNPPTEWHQRPSTQYASGTEWNGQVWKAVVRFRLRHPEIEVVTVDTDWGCTIVRPSRPARRQLDAKVLTQMNWQAFETNRTEWLNLVSVSRFLRGLHYLRWTNGRDYLSSRTDMLNALISRFDVQRYLEIGVGQDKSFGHIIAPVRQSVGLADSATFSVSSDAFFKDHLGCPAYDLVFIEGSGSEEECFRDMENAMKRLSSGGLMVLRRANVCRAIVRFQQCHPDAIVFTVDVDQGCTLIVPPTRPREGEDQDGIPAELAWQAFGRGRKQLLNLVSPEAFCQMLRENGPHAECLQGGAATVDAAEAKVCEPPMVREASG
jgi:hypothetical protein